METYLIPIRTAFLFFPIVAMMLLIPFLIFQYRKYGYVNYIRSFILYSLLLYGMTAFFLVVLPLPQTSDTCRAYGPDASFAQLVPFEFVRDFLRETNVSWARPDTYLSVLRERAFLQAAYNFILLLPLGVYLRYYFRRQWISTVLITFGVSLFFEVTQRTGIYGIYPCPYRIFDVDDLMLNTAGGAVGYWVAPMFTFFMPRSDKLDAHVDLSTMKVGLIRRFIAFGVDWFLIAAVMRLLDPAYRRSPGVRSYLLWNFYDHPGGIVLAVLLYFIVLPYVTKGMTFGKWLLRIRLVGRSARVGIGELAVRYGILYYGVGGIFYLLAVGFDYNRGNPIVSLMFAGLSFVLFFIAAIHAALHFFGKDKRLFYEKISKTGHIIEQKSAADGDR